MTPIRDGKSIGSGNIGNSIGSGNFEDCGTSVENRLPTLRYGRRVGEKVIPFNH